MDRNGYQKISNDPSPNDQEESKPMLAPNGKSQNKDIEMKDISDTENKVRYK